MKAKKEPVFHSTVPEAVRVAFIDYLNCCYSLGYNYLDLKYNSLSNLQWWDEILRKKVIQGLQKPEKGAIIERVITEELTDIGVLHDCSIGDFIGSIESLKDRYPDSRVVLTSKEDYESYKDYYFLALEYKLRIPISDREYEEQLRDYKYYIVLNEFLRITSPIANIAKKQWQKYQKSQKPFTPDFSDLKDKD